MDRRMKRLLAAFIFLCVTINVAHSAIAWTAGSGASFNQTVVGTATTFNNIINNGTAIPSGALACFALITRQGAGVQPLTATIGGISATQINTDGGSQLFLYCATMPSSETDQVIISGVNNFGVELAAGGFFTGSATTATATGCATFGDQNSNSAATLQVTCTAANTTISNPTGGIGIVAVYSQVGTAGTSCGTFTWSTTGSSNITASAGDVNVCLNTKPDNLSLAHTTTVGSWGPSASSSPTFGSNSAMVAATFAPSATSSGGILLLAK
jgi:hypothetical protein